MAIMAALVAKQKTNETEHRPWSELPEDILLLIINHLHIVERFHLGLVCKRLLSIASSAPRHNGLLLGSPCLLLLANGNKTCNLINPQYKEKYIVNTTCLPSSEVRTVCSKDGWLLMVSSDRNHRTIFFFNPLSKATIDLPDADFWPSNCAFSFTSPPTSPDCLVVAIIAMHGIASIYTCRRRVSKWSENFVVIGGTFNMSYTNPVFHQGKFYCLGDNGTLCIYNPVDETWAAMEKTLSGQLNSHRIHLVESDGELYRVWIKKNGDSVNVHKLDPVRKQWKVMDGIGDHEQFYVGATSICSNTAASRNGGRIYFQMLQDEQLVSYSCETGKMHPAVNFYGAKDYPLACWIEPKWIQPLPEELQWSKV